MRDFPMPGSPEIRNGNQDIMRGQQLSDGIEPALSDVCVGYQPSWDRAGKAVECKRANRLIFEQSAQKAVRDDRDQHGVGISHRAQRRRQCRSLAKRHSIVRGIIARSTAELASDHLPPCCLIAR
jgi:hypothetical protein